METMSSIDGQNEIELKLSVEPQDIETVIAHPSVVGRVVTPFTTKKLRSIYFDTHDRRLRRRKMSLRVRRSGRRYTQTLKAAGDSSGGIMERGEWEVDVTGSVPELDKIDDSAATARLGLVLAEELEPVCTTNITRKAALLEWREPNGEAALIEIAVDRGDIETANGGEAISEVEFELKRGSPRALFSIVQELCDAVPVRLGTEEKGSRGFRIADGLPPPWQKAEKPKLNSTMTVEEGLEVIFRSCVGQWVGNEAASYDGRDSEGVHQIRVSLRRARSALSMFKTVIGADQFEHWNGELRWLIQQFGPARDLDVFLEETLNGIETSLPDEPSLAVLRDVAQEQQAAAYDHVRETIDSSRYARLLLEFSAWVNLRGWRRGADADRFMELHAPLPGLANELLAKRYRKAMKKGKNFGNLPWETRHEVRILLKKLRYGTEFMSQLFPEKAARRYAKHAAAIQDVLGYANDIAVSRSVVDGLTAGVIDSERKLQTAKAAGLIIGWFCHGARDIDKMSEDAWREFQGAKPFWRPAS